MKIIVLGYYFRDNLGDDLFIVAIEKLFSPHQCIFKNPDDLVSLPECDLVVVGGGDLVNDYFIPKIRTLMQGKRIPLYGIGIGFPYPSLITKDYLSIFDIIVTRTASVYNRLCEIMPGRAFLCDDLVFSLPTEKRKGGHVGIFFASSMLTNDKIFEKLLYIVNHIASIKGRGCGGMKYSILLCNMNTNKGAEGDYNVNNKIFNRLSYPNLKVVDVTTKNYNEIFQNLSYAICTRFHAHVLSYMYRIPFVSLYSTYKDKDFLERYDFDDGVEMDTNIKLQPIDFDEKEVLEKFYSLPQKMDKKPPVFDDWIFRNLPFYLPRYGDKLVKRTLYDIEKGWLKDDPAKAITFFITRSFDAPFTWGLRENMKSESFKLEDAVRWILNNIPTSFPYWDNKISFCNRKFNIGFFSQPIEKGIHRSGWPYVVDNLQPLHNPCGIILDTFADKTFGWERDSLTKMKILPFRKRWIGIFHHTFDTVYSRNNLLECIKSEPFQKSLEYCEYIIVLSKYLQKEFSRYVNVPIHVLYHPADFNVYEEWTPQKYKDNQNKRVIQVGAWLRNSYGIWALPQPRGLIKSVLKGKGMENYFPPQNFITDLKNGLGVIDGGSDGPCRGGPCRAEYNKFITGFIERTKEILDGVEILSYLDPQEYDKLFSCNVIFLNLQDVSACNTVIECIVRNTPIVVNRLPALEEYLGKDYPLYYSTYEEATRILEDYKLLKEGYKYLSKMDKSFLKMEKFIEELLKL